MQYRVLARLIATVCLALVAARASAQATSNTFTVGLLYDPIFHVEGDTSSVGAHFDVAREVRKLASSNIQGVAEIGFNHFEGGSISSFMGGGRWAGRVDKALPFFQLLLGLDHVGSSLGSSSNDFAIQPGFGVDYQWRRDLMVRAQIDFRRVFSDFSFTGTRLGIGVVVPLNIK